MLERSKHEMPDFVRTALLTRGLTKEYEKRPDYQKNDYIGWIMQATKQETKTKRLNQMLDELEKGGIYMNMEHPASRKE